MISINKALLFTAAAGGVIFLCRFLPFVLFKEKTGHSKRIKAFLEFVEASVPAAAMTVLAANALASPLKEAVTAQQPAGIIPLGAAAMATAVLHLWKRNPLISIFGGTALYMLLSARMFLL